MKDGKVLVFPRAIFSEAFSLLPGTPFNRS